MCNAIYSVDVNPIEDVIQAFAAGEFVVLLDHPDREGEADLIVPMEFATGAKLNIMTLVARGLICACLPQKRLAELGIPLIQPVNCVGNWPHFAEPVDYTIGTTSGASAFDLATTARALTDPDVDPALFARPGHLQVLGENEDRFAGRMGHTEGTVGLARLANLCPAALLAEIMAPDGSMAAGETLQSVVSENKFLVTTVQEIAEASKE